MIGSAPACLKCKHYYRNNYDGLKCKAFKSGIPDEIIVNGNPHTKPLHSQKNDIIFEPESK